MLNDGFKFVLFINEKKYNKDLVLFLIQLEIIIRNKYDYNFDFTYLPIKKV